MQLQLNKIYRLENKLVKSFSKEKWKEYFDLDVEKGQHITLQIKHIVKITYKIYYDLFNRHNL